MKPQTAAEFAEYCRLQAIVNAHRERRRLADLAKGPVILWRGERVGLVEVGEK